MARGRTPQYGDSVRTRVIQLRAANPQKPLSIDRIIDALGDTYGVDPVPSRGWVGAVVKEFDDLEKTRPGVWAQEMPFEWHRLERASVPWEASAFVLKCQWEYASDMLWPQLVAGQMGPSAQEFLQEVLDRAPGEPFTNRWAKWCWRVHQAAPDLSAFHAMSVADTYVKEEQRQDFSKVGHVMFVPEWDAWLCERPDAYRDDQYGSADEKRNLFALRVEWGYVPGFGDVNTLLAEKDIDRIKRDLAVVSPRRSPEMLLAQEMRWLKGRLQLILASLPTQRRQELAEIEAIVFPKEVLS